MVHQTECPISIKMAYYPSYNDVEHKYFQLHQFFQYFFLSDVTFWSYGVPPLSGWDILNMTYTIWNITLPWKLLVVVTPRYDYV